MEVDTNQIDTSPKWQSLIRDFKRLIVVSLIIAVCAGVMYAFTFNGGLSTDNSVWGAFGDFMGGVLNPIFGFTGLLALLLTISMQSEELSNSTKELRNSADALKEQSESLKRQNFEHTFFQLIKFHNDVIESLSYGRENSTSFVKGRAYLTKVYRGLNTIFKKSLNDSTTPADAIEKAVMDTLKSYKVEHYFAGITNILKFIDESDTKEKEIYIRTVKSQISHDEFALLFYWGLYLSKGLEFRALAERHSLFSEFDPMSAGDELKPCVSLYDMEAYGGQLKTNQQLSEAYQSIPKEAEMPF